MQNQETILYFGSFNPPHRGHIAIADAVLEATGAEALWLVVSPRSPFKTETELVPERHRLEMAALAARNARNADRITACDIEFTLPKPTRTIDTLRRLETLYPRRKFSLLLGSDNVDGFDRWKEYRTILERFRILVYPREGYAPRNKELASRFTFLDGLPLQPHAATDIREHIAAGTKPAESLDPAVEEYIKKERLYGYSG